jgi:hypothetical protein
MRKLLIRAAVLVMAACLAGCPSPEGGGDPSGGDGPGTGRFTYTAWVDEDGELYINASGNLDISKSGGEALEISAASDLTDIQWSLNGTDIPAPRGTAGSITIEAASYHPGSVYTLGLFAKKGGSPYSTTITFTVGD